MEGGWRYRWEEVALPRGASLGMAEARPRGHGEDHVDRGTRWWDGRGEGKDARFQ